MRIGIIVQARMSSSRLPGKMMMEADGKPMIWYVMSSLAKCSGVDELILSTSDLESDDPLAEYSAAQGYPVFRGPLEDVAGRFMRTIEEFKLDAFVRICGDSPLVDNRLVDEAVSLFKSGEYDIVSNIIKRTYPKGQSVEVISSPTFKRLFDAGMDEHDREHVTPKIYRNLESLKSFSMESENNCGTVQLSVDTPEDFASFETMLAKMDKEHFEYTWQEKLTLLDKDKKCLK
ncbi:cytidylyltransferase domain-containing protein [Desulfovibrio sp. JC010]|uniref:cytidylyltransferase domain-containing protein n=1 Tax=Desulfovibrio sp. JC010 TaxID=2593641 RepID=UPI0013D2523C|nr:NTP transferase domain-containing protein [Desulfovibrio sp. JC010]NDV27158.1 flagellin modification protein FlmC [Desulfovibrio sp. JC010]